MTSSNLSYLPKDLIPQIYSQIKSQTYKFSGKHDSAPNKLFHVIFSTRKHFHYVGVP